MAYKDFIIGAFTASGQSASLVVIKGLFGVEMWGTFVATTSIERSFDGGTTWVPQSIDGAGTPASYLVPCTVYPEEVVGFGDNGALPRYRLNCTWTSGTVNFRLSQNIP